MFRRRARWFVVLAVLLNASGGPMAFAHSAAMSAGDSAPAQVSREHCAGHASQPAPADSASELACCAGGHCACPAVSTFLPAGAPALVQFVRYLLADDPRLAEPPSISLSDPLRPPIAASFTPSLLR